MINKYIYAEFLKGTNKHNGNIINITKLKPSDYTGFSDCHLSVFRFDESIIKYIEKNKTETSSGIGGYGGIISFDNIAIDFDNTDVEKARTDLIQVVRYGLLENLAEEDLKHLKIAFSGNKGFHLSIPGEFCGAVKPSLDLNEQVKLFVEKLKFISETETGEKTNSIDFQIYTKISLLRIVNSINPKSNLYKIPLSFKELETFSIDEIKNLSRKPREFKYPSRSEIKPKLAELFQSIIYEMKQVEKANTSSKDKNRINLLTDVKSGERNKYFFDLLRKYRYHGMNETELTEIALLKNNTISKPLEEEELRGIIKSVCKKTVNFENKIIGREDFATSSDREEEYKQYIKDIERRKFNLGFKIIDDRLRGMRPGNLFVVLAETGIGKSSLVQNILQKFSKETGKISLYISLEMDNTEIYERENQIENDLSGFEVENFIKNGKTFENKNDNFITITNPVNIEKIQEYIEKCREYFGEPGLICLDHNGLIGSRERNNSDEYSRTTYIMKVCKRLARINKIAFIVVSQINRISAINKNERISLFSGKNSGEVENSSDAVLSLEKITCNNFGMFKYDNDVLNESTINDYDNKGITLLCINILKNRKGGYAQSILEFNRRNLRMDESKLNDVQLSIYETVSDLRPPEKKVREIENVF